MAALLFLLFLSAFSLAAARISPSSTLTPTGKNSSWLSPSGLYAFGFYPIGNGYAVGVFLNGIPDSLRGIPDKTVVWTANRDSAIHPLNVTLVLTNDGRLILQQSPGQEVDIVNLAEDKIASASMLDSGNFVLYNSANNTIWQSFDYPTDTLLPTQRLITDDGQGQGQLFSSASENDPSTGPFRLIMQQDGTLVQYPTDAPSLDPYAYYSSYTNNGGPHVTLNLDPNGYLYLLRDNGTIIFNVTQGFPDQKTIYRATIDVDGIFRLYSYSLQYKDNWIVRYNTTSNKCEPKGICGLNAFCSNVDTDIECKCIPGFDFISPGDLSSGCQRNFSQEGCQSPKEILRFTMMPIPNTVWENASYDTFKTSIRQECEQACLNDCNCGAALFGDGGCSKQRLPLKYGKRVLTNPKVALVKVGMPGSPVGGGPSYPQLHPKKKLRLDILIISISLLVFALVILVISGVLIHIHQLGAHKNMSRYKNAEPIGDVAPRAFTYAELERATNDFKEELGQGAFGTVYKGMLMDFQKTVAVKRLEKILAEGEAEREFHNEMAVIGKTHHRNLVRLLGYCADGPKKLLVYEYMSSGSLADVLYAKENQPNWDEGIKIACDIARGILYLHEECETQIIHCDIKPQNILMDEHRCAKISDFGLAKLLKHDQTKTFTAIRGTKGYVAPEWHKKLPVTVKADVYSYGIVLLEIICRRKNIDWSFPEDQAILEEYAYDCFEAQELHKLFADDELVNMRQLERMIKIAIWCIQGEPSLRPTMKKVLLMLEGTVDIPIPPNPTSFLSST
ncbi:G-type lectin S-receptor-like serine/threonine-protein kinase LECRK3 [Coffea eugenioides]|uniref:Receptor-like serine/threonine-protein kinase n=1 Tax=Coffea arabica TaxID=13443 RepID=A0A6P6TFB0_COFAR|nr:G-type lectin S-receptor-like serine/threonine-protein kinase LECRK3 [Coffea arabica]XP_027179759.1 G-type lectin S-receptor-like serine/threonine-protein kinase LECRK3 [Coffea eugenioides]XP_027179766.1 G-type lectin S-receptor-like serine/threonine-protein kinase LECRK3 [Coffea eugenioides]